MIRHVVLFQFAEEFEERTALENAKIAKGLLLSLTEKLDFIRKMEVGINHSEADNSNYTLCLTCDFDNMEDLNRYSTHPEHLKVGEFIKKVRIGRACTDYVI